MMLQRTHELKTWPEFFNAILRGDKTFEARLNDRDFQQNDWLYLQEWDPKLELKYTGRLIVRRVAYILYGPQMGIEEVWRNRYEYQVRRSHPPKLLWAFGHRLKWLCFDCEITLIPPGVTWNPDGTHLYQPRDN